MSPLSVRAPLAPALLPKTVSVGRYPGWFMRYCCPLPDADTRYFSTYAHLKVTWPIMIVPCDDDSPLHTHPCIRGWSIIICLLATTTMTNLIGVNIDCYYIRFHAAGCSVSIAILRYCYPFSSFSSFSPTTAPSSTIIFYQ